MNPLKRKFTFNDDQHEAKKKLPCTFDQETISITSMENLSDEFFYEIFDYLSACEIYHAFSNLNHRFQRLLHSSSLLFKMTSALQLSYKVFLDTSKHLICFHQAQLLSINLSMPLRKNEFFASFAFNSSLSRLESLVLSSVKLTTDLSCLQQLIYLPRLFSLTLEMNRNLTDLSDLYRIIFALPVLKAFIFHSSNSYQSVSLPVNTNKEYSPIQYLLIGHYCTFQELSSIISYIPNLCRLNVASENRDQSNVGTIWPMKLVNLTHLTVLVDDVKFEELENFITKLDCQLNVFSFRSHALCDLAYLDGHRWETFLLKYFPQLKEFYLRYDEALDYTESAHLYPPLFRQFFSSFWIERQWLLDIKTANEILMYLVRPYRQRWYEDDRQDKIADLSTQLSKSARLIMTCLEHYYLHDIDFIDINHILTIAQIYHLEIVGQKIFATELLQRINTLPELLSLKVHSLVLDQSTGLSDEELIIVCSTRLTSKITHVYLEKMNRIEDIAFLMALCPYLICLQVDCIGEINIEFFLRSILKNINHEWNDYPRSLCFGLPAADDRMMNYVDNIIRSEQLLINYRIKRVLDRIYLKWT